MWSTRGVHQGDTMGPLGFALGLEAALDSAAQATGHLTWGTWYLDDGILLGSPSQILAAWEALVPPWEGVGWRSIPANAASGDLRHSSPMRPVSSRTSSQQIIPSAA